MCSSMTFLASLGRGGMAPGVWQWEDVDFLGRTGSVEWWLPTRRSWEGASNLPEEFSLANTAVMLVSSPKTVDLTLT